MRSCAEHGNFGHAAPQQDVERIHMERASRSGHIGFLALATNSSTRMIFSPAVSRWAGSGKEPTAALIWSTSRARFLTHHATSSTLRGRFRHGDRQFSELAQYLHPEVGGQLDDTWLNDLDVYRIGIERARGIE